MARFRDCYLFVAKSERMRQPRPLGSYIWILRNNLNLRPSERTFIRTGSISNWVPPSTLCTAFIITCHHIVHG